MATRGSKHAKKLGKWGEDQAQEWLENRGYQLVARNFRTEYGEIDLIMQKEDRLHFVEVKTRQTKHFGNPEESITGAKLAHMVESAHRFLQLHPEFDGDWQVDVMAIFADPKNDITEMKWIENVS